MFEFHPKKLIIFATRTRVHVLTLRGKLKTLTGPRGWTSPAIASYACMPSRLQSRSTQNFKILDLALLHCKCVHIVERHIFILFWVPLRWHLFIEVQAIYLRGRNHLRASSIWCNLFVFTTNLRWHLLIDAFRFRMSNWRIFSESQDEELQMEWIFFRTLVFYV